VDLRAPWREIGIRWIQDHVSGWGSADAIRQWHLVKKGSLQKRQRLSVRYPWMAGKEAVEGRNYLIMLNDNFIIAIESPQ
jgi:hypothetical protein